jgi:hypothetical protein
MQKPVEDMHAAIAQKNINKAISKAGKQKKVIALLNR